MLVNGLILHILSGTFWPRLVVPGDGMICPRCRIKMVEQKRTFHKKRKWVCPRCKLVCRQEQLKRK